MPIEKQFETLLSRQAANLSQSSLGHAAHDGEDGILSNINAQGQNRADNLCGALGMHWAMESQRETQYFVERFASDSKELAHLSSEVLW